MKGVYIIAAAMLAFAGCMKEQPAQMPEPEAAVYTIEVTSNSAVSPKTTIIDNGDNYSVNWTSDDAISVNGQESAGLTIDSDNAKKAKFTFASELTTPYHSVYPASAYKAESLADGTATVVIPAVQTYAEKNFDPAAAIMLGYSEIAGSLAFEHAVAYMQIKVTTSDGAAVKMVSIKGNSNETMSGEFIADFVCLPIKLIVELDGRYHSLPEQQISDEERTRWLQQYGFRVIRFTNEQVLCDIDNVLLTIKKNMIYGTE